MDKEIDEALMDAEESLRVAIDACEALARICDEQNAGESGGAAGRMNAYIIPALNTWLYSDSQIASLRDLREEIERGWTSLQREHNEDGHGFHTPRGDWPDRPSEDNS